MSLEIKSKLQSLLTAANTKTGESDTTLTDAVQTLIDGYGQGGEQITLPAEYQRVEYISKINSSGAYINTGYVPEMDTNIYVRVSINGKRDQKFFGGFGSGTAGSGAGFALAQIGDTWRATIGISWKAIGTAVVDEPADFLVELRETRYTVWIDNQALLNTVNKELFYPLYILATNYNNSASGGFGGNIYRVTVRRGDTVLRDYIPCYRKADGVIGMYEIMTETFLTNAGSGSFGKGADVR